MRIFLWTVVFLGAGSIGLAEEKPAAEGNPSGEKEALAFFEAKIRPMFVEHCYECHSAGSKLLKGGLHLDTREGSRKGGDTAPAVVPGSLEKSLILQALEYTDENLKMPPKGKLPDAVIKDFRRWIASGAPDSREPVPTVTRKPIDLAAGRQFWSFAPLKRPAVPRAEDPWIRSDIDRFILAKLSEKGLRPSPMVDRPLLIRRAYYDLLGLPPTQEQIAAFVRDPDPQAYEKLIEQLLASPHYGERWGRHWLDLARYADSSGYENDNDRPLAYHYRDFVIEALNRDLPYDQFVRWQIAGDELAPDNPLARKATGFFACGPMNGQVTEREAEKERYDVLDDWVGTMGTAFLGVTIGCARCHDHKFDPVPTEDYYRIVASLSQTVRVVQNVNLEPEAWRKTWDEFSKTHAGLIETRRKFEDELLVSRTAAWLKVGPKLANSPWLVLTAKELTSGGSQTTVVTRFRQREDGAYLVAEANGEIASHTLEADIPLQNVRALRLEVPPDESLPKFGPGLGDGGDFQMHKLDVTAIPLRGEAKPIPVKLVKVRTGTASGSPPVANANDAGGWSFAPANQDPQWAVWEFEQPINVGGGIRLRIHMSFSADNPAGRKALGCFRFSVAAGEGLPEPNLADIPLVQFAQAREGLAAAEESRTDAQKQALQQLAARYDPQWQVLQRAVQTSWQNRPWPKIDVALMTTEARNLVPMRMKIQGPDYYDKSYLLRRGSVEQKAGEVPPGFLRVLMRTPQEEKAWLAPPPTESRTSFRRAALAHWLTDVDQGAGHSLARVIVNRLWQHHVGRPLVLTPSDFGVQGDRPVHGELLDYLASELVERKWSLKSMHKLIMTSGTYMQASSRRRAENSVNPREVDPDNRLFWHRPLVRLEAEVIRDSMLTASGRLDARLFGPGTLDEAMTRRSIYFTVKRSKLIPSLSSLDWPDTLAGLAQRPTTTVAPQALLLLNNPQVRASAEALAARLKPELDRLPEQAINIAFLSTIGRHPTTRERDASLRFLEQQGKTYSGPSAPQAALADLCQTLFGMNEFFYIP